VAVAELQALEREAVMGTYARLPVEFVHGEGTRLWDDEGNEYLDFLCGISVTQLGHSPPPVVAAVREQAGRLMHTGNLFYTEPGMRLAKRLADSSVGGKVFFSNSGAEASECAIKLARRHRPGGGFVVSQGGFHGRTMGALSATPQETKQAPFAPLVPGFSVVPRNDPDALRAAVDDSTAAVILEPIQGESGIHPLTNELLHAARGACDEHGALLVLDEVQCGMGRTGSLWAWQGVGVRPDVMTAAKGLGGGVPIGACVAAPAYAGLLQPGDHGSTFAGGPLVCAAANAVLEVIDEEKFLAGVRRRGERLAGGLRSLGLDVRGRGLMLAFAVEDAPELMRRLLLEQRLVTHATGPDTLRLLPPLTVSDDEIDEALRRIGDALGT
jgi:acetylornithine/N-succinyldiaminopimelate aminotransferase